ncbi:MAG TPA: glutamate racemase, partial [bacterium]|nr:glutamate racemase [bacterium]
LAPWKGRELDTLILGCTHYPILKPLLQEVMGPGVTLVDSAQETAKALQVLLAERILLAPGSKPGSRRFFTTDAPQKMVELAARFLGHEIPSAELARLGSD